MLAFLLFPPSASRNNRRNNFKTRELPTCALVSKTFGAVQINFILVTGVNITPVIKSSCVCVCSVQWLNLIMYKEPS